MPTNNFSVIIDNFDMGITHVRSGYDHFNNTPTQMNMLEALGADIPVYTQLPMIFGRYGAKLSKRHSAVDIREYRDQGYLPEALLNYLVRLGWSHGDQEVFSIEEMIDLFNIADINQSASAFNPAKLQWLNQQHIMATPLERIGRELVLYLNSAGLDPSKGPDPQYVAAGFRERSETLLHMTASARYCYEDFTIIEPKAAKKNLRPVILEPLKATREKLAALNEWTKEGIAQSIEKVAQSFEITMSKIGQPIRVAVTNGPVSPPLDVTVWLVGQERTINRLDHAIELIEGRAAGNGD